MLALWFIHPEQPRGPASDLGPVFSTETHSLSSLWRGDVLMLQQENQMFPSGDGENRAVIFDSEITRWHKHNSKWKLASLRYCSMGKYATVCQQVQRIKFQAEVWDSRRSPTLIPHEQSASVAWSWTHSTRTSVRQTPTAIADVSQGDEQSAESRNPPRSSGGGTQRQML